MEYKWTEKLSVKNPVLDDQHKIFISLVNEIEDLSKVRDVDKTVREALSFLEDYAKKHFAYEESYFMSYDYPLAREHKTMHLYFIDNVEKLKDELKITGATMELASKIAKFVGDWLINHIKTHDKKYSEWIEKRK